MSNVIGISGKIGSGKDTFGKLIIKHYPQYKHKSFAEKLKFICHYLTNQPLEDMYTQEGKNKYLPEWGMTVGELQQKVGTEAMRDGVHPDTWVLALSCDYGKDDHWIFTDLRFPNEAQWIRSMGGLLVRMEGDPAGVRANSKRDQTHYSEVALDDWPDWDLVVPNSPGMLESGELESYVLRLF